MIEVSEGLVGGIGGTVVFDGGYPEENKEKKREEREKDRKDRSFFSVLVSRSNEAEDLIFNSWAGLKLELKDNEGEKNEVKSEKSNVARKEEES